MNKVLLFAMLLFSSVVLAQEKPLDMKMDFEDYDPPSSLVVEEHRLTRSKFPFIDIHNHQGNMPTSDFKDLIAAMDKLNMAIMVNLSGRGFGGSGDHLERSIENIKSKYPSRFVLFTNVDFRDIDNPEWSARICKQLEDDVKRGAKGLKIYKSLGMFSRDKDGKRVHIDDPRIDPVWAKCGQLGIPVLIHAADPKQFWDPIDKNNERWLELKLHPGRRHDTDSVKWETIIKEAARFRYPQATFGRQKSP